MYMHMYTNTVLEAYINTYVNTYIHKHSLRQIHTHRHISESCIMYRPQLPLKAL